MPIHSSTMDTLIAETTFLHDNADKHEEFIRDLRQLSSNSGDKTLDLALKALSILQDKLTTSDQPIHETEGWKQALDTYKQIANYCR